MIIRQSARTFVDRVDFKTSVGARRQVVITDLGVLRPNPETKELTLVALHPGATVEAAREATGWDLKTAENTAVTDPPTENELRHLRELKARTEAARKGTSA